MPHYLCVHKVVLTCTKGLPHGPAIVGLSLVDCNVIIKEGTVWAYPELHAGRAGPQARGCGPSIIISLRALRAEFFCCGP